MAELYTERELKFDVPSDFTVPDLRDVVDGARVERGMVRLVSTYFDTPTYALLAHRITLRRREGDADVGWQLKIPGKAARTEIRLPLPEHAAVPDELAGLVAGLLGGEALQPVAQLRTERGVHSVCSDNRTLVEVADDHVRASTSGDALRVLEWREVEAELVDGTEKTLQRVGKRLLEAGARPAESASKLARALDRPSGPTDPAAALVAAYLGEQLAVLGSGDVGFRRGLEPVHRTRVAVRRFRSILRVFAPAFETETAALDAELSWYQGLLGAVRDREVQRQRFADALRRLPDELVLGPVVADLDAALSTEQRAAHEQLLQSLDSDRYRGLLTALRATAQRPGLRDGVTPDDLVWLAGKAQRTAHKRLRRALNGGSAEQLHRARKAHKRARYAAELIEPAAGKAARRIVKLDKKIQEILGEHQDAIDAADVLRRLGGVLGAQAERNGFTYGVLWQREQEAAAAARRRAQRFA